MVDASLVIDPTMAISMAADAFHARSAGSQD
jgi:hypothetical protein